ncbi:ABC transporter permease [Paenibacillus sp. SYP-B3998]|uniref:ABC transporter permease n=1 Tax=Paenibacillus sp. SYP-B3998 TaxID=2678564 RepID=A0A6G4A6X7_9BACL|nr:ABC transporter permease [Paenibacillus sp. SYP-B3998]NEW09387.1 ABC transporter permease [Paenibacillus sp. SYP-B3998]
MMSKYYLKRETQRKLKAFQEYRLSNFAWSASLVIAILFLFNGYDLFERTVHIPFLACAGIYLIFGLLQLLVSVKIKKDVLEAGAIQTSTRIFGFSLIIALLTGNIFVAIAALDMIKKGKTIEYTLSIYMALTNFCIIMISALNIFKPYVADLFVLGMGILLVISIIHVLTMILISSFVKNGTVDRRLLPLAYLLIFTSFTGNVFSLLLGFTLLSKIKNGNKEVPVTWIDILRRLFRNSMAALGLLFITVLLSVSICSYFTFEYTLAIENNYSTLLLPPSLEYPFGTDDFGRCVFSRIVFGGRISLLVGIISTLIPVLAGGGLGALSGYYGKYVDNFIMRALDILYAVPGMLLAIAIVAAFGANTTNLIIALSIGYIPTYARTMRATVLSVSNFEFIEAARACGAKDHIIIFKHIIPNSLAPIIVKATLTIGVAVISTSSLSYLGLGVEPHIPEWGNILKIGSEYLESKSYLAVYPGLAIIMMVLSFNFFGDGLRDALDPKLK